MASINAAKRLVVKSGAAKRLAAAVIHNDPEHAREQLGPLLERQRFFNNADLPKAVDGFHDLAFLFASTRLDSGIALLTITEAAHLWRTAARIPAGPIVEIGRFKGGSTTLIATAMGDHCRLYSYDLHAKLAGLYDYAVLDEDLTRALSRLGVSDRVEVIVGDSRTAPPPDEPCQMVFIDGDHSYAGARADFDRWKEHLAPGAPILFHDGRIGPMIGGDPNVVRVVREAEAEGWHVAATADTIVELRRP